MIETPNIFEFMAKVQSTKCYIFFRFCEEKPCSFPPKLQKILSLADKLGCAAPPFFFCRVVSLGEKIHKRYAL